MIGLGLSILQVAVRGGGGGVSYDADAEALFTRMSAAPDATRKQLVSDTITALKAEGVWAKSAAIWVPAAHDQQAGRLNWKGNAAYDLVAINSPDFTADRGFTGDGATSYLDTSYVAPVDPGIAQNDAHLSVWLAGITTVGNVYEVANARMAISARNGTTVVRVLANSSGNANVTVPGLTAAGLTAWSRASASDFELFKDGVSMGTTALASAAPLATSLFILAYNSAGSPLLFSPRRVQAASVGFALTAGEQAALHAILNTYMTTIGAS